MADSMTDRQQLLSAHLQTLEQCLCELACWASEPPSAEALASTQPFCVDTLSFPQWLQFVFIARLRTMLALNQPLPDNCAVAPMAQEYVKSVQASLSPVIEILADIDRLLSR